VKCIQHGICSQTVFKNAKVMFFFEVGRGGQQFSFGYKKIPGRGKNFAGWLPPPGYDIPHSS
jgi:hypothetical protein